MATAAQIVSKAVSQIGVKESPANSNNVKYNTVYYGRAVSGSGYAWCATFVWWVFYECDATNLLPLGKKSAYCPTIGDYIIASGRRVSKSAGQPGDIVLFDWNKNNSSDHIGIIEKRNSDGSYSCIEGNTSVNNNSNGGQVMRRVRYQSQISHIYRPPYTGGATVSATTASTGKLAVDGEWGQTTTLMTQKVMGTVRDGIVSGQLPSCKKYMLNCLTSSWKFVSGGGGSTMVKAIQGLVGTTRDGYAGKNTVKAMQKFLNARGYSCGSVDGYMGKKTVMAWQRYINSRL